MFAFGWWAAKKCFCMKKVHVKMIWKYFLYNFMVLLNGLVQNALFCLMDRYRNVCVWFMARNCRFPKVGTHGSQRGNHRLPLQGTAGSQRLKLLVPNLGTKGCHCKELPVPTGWDWCFQRGNQRLPLQGTAASHTLKLMFPTWERKVTIARNCRFTEVRPHVFQPKRFSL